MPSANMVNNLTYGENVKLIFRAWMRLQTLDFAQAESELNKLVEQNGGYFESETDFLLFQYLNNYVLGKKMWDSSLDTEALHNAVSETQTCDLHEIKNGAEGTADLDSPKTVLLSIPYNEGFTVKVNGESVSYREVLSSFMAFDLPAGHSDIKISFRPRGFTGGLIMSAAGVLSFAAFVLFTKRRKLPDVREATDEKKAFTYRVGCYLTAAFGIMIFLLVYVMPILLNILFWKPEKK